MASDAHPKPPAKSKPNGKPKGKKLSQKEQSARFIETARQIEADESGKSFDLAVGTVIRPADRS